MGSGHKPLYDGSNAVHNPGPGSYTLKDPMVHTHNAASMKSRTTIPTSRDSVPGPGQYALKTLF